MVQIRPHEVSLDNKESFGFLSDRLIGIGSSFLTRSPESGLYILSKCVLKNRDAYTLRFVDLKFNRITDLMEILNLKGFISKIDFRGNACTKWPNYRNILISSISSIKFIDGVQVFPEEKQQERITYEEKAKALKNIYIELVIKSRKLYLDYHKNHPGFFTLVLLMDNYTKAFDSLINFIHESYTNLPYRKSIFFSETHHFKHTAISVMLESIIDKIRENLSISKLQRRKILKLEN
ncbi:hypothetical protein G5I_09116 [Acromyrmex echinatior]|uniref:Uncharacterized protein n=1 Tax=Acromyrmex echinatior TaxID=103372 RepID=F4WT87_ACREC|nr:hypothetical protein G5I_09116 [Acromyrmex echinatior]